MKKTYIIIAVVIIVLIGIVFFLRSPEDAWIKDERGVWVQHGKPRTTATPNEVVQQQRLIVNAQQLFEQFKTNLSEPISSQCLGTIGGYAIDIVHVPRTAEDDLPKNQCEDYRSGKVQHFIELDRDGNVVRIIV
jgi:hypothetical protein